MTTGGPVARLLTPVITRVLVLVALLAGIAVSGVVVSTRAVQHLTDELQPAAAAHQDVLQDLSDMQGAVRAYAQAGRQDSLDDYRQALARLPGHQQQVARFSRAHPELDGLVSREAAAAQVWVDDYAALRVARRGGPGSFDAGEFRTGVEQFEAFRDLHGATAAAFDARLRQAREQAGIRLRGTILAVLLIAGLGTWGVARARRRILAELGEPLRQLEQTVQRMVAQERDVRAADSGPREVRAVAAALNQLADAQARAADVEEHIRAELRRLDTAKDDFVANVSHELRTPLTTIAGYLELVADEFEDRLKPRHERMLEASRRNVTRLRALIDDLLTLSRAESRATDLEQVDLAAAVRDAVTDVRMTASRRGIRIDVREPGGAMAVLGDKVMLHRALLNLLTNAVKFSHDGSVVEVSAGPVGASWAVRVRDRGIGIPAVELGRLGSRFFRASNAVSQEIAGTGLGIRIVQTIVDMHAGDLIVDSVEGHGTEVIVRLPARAPVPSADPAAGPGAAAPDEDPAPSGEAVPAGRD